MEELGEQRVQVEDREAQEDDEASVEANDDAEDILAHVDDPEVEVEETDDAGSP